MKFVQTVTRFIESLILNTIQDADIIERITQLTAASPAHADILDRLDNAITIAKMGGIDQRTLEVVLGYAAIKQLTPGTTAALNSVGIDTRPWAEVVDDAGGWEAVRVAGEDMGFDTASWTPTLNTPSRRESIERIIQKSAEWGYSIGRSGAANMTPVIEWGEDGSWKITTDTPPP